MKLRLLIAGVLAGVVAFFWGFFSHTVIGVGESSMKVIPNEAAVLSTMSGSIKESGFYFFPGSGMEAEKLPKDQQEAALKKWDEDYKTQPHGILILTQPSGTELPFAKNLSVQLATCILSGLLAAFLLSLAAPSLPSLLGRVLFVAVLGVFATIDIDVPYWNWYGFPTRYLVAQMIDSVVGWGLGACQRP